MHFARLGLFSDESTFKLPKLSSESVTLAPPVFACTLATNSCVVFTLGVRALDAIFSFRISPTDVACVTEALADTRLNFTVFFRRVLVGEIGVVLEPLTVPVIVGEHTDDVTTAVPIKTVEAVVTAVIVLCAEVVVSVATEAEQMLDQVKDSVAAVVDVTVVAIVVVVGVVIVVVTAVEEVISKTISTIGTLLCNGITSQLLEPWLRPLMLSRLPSPWISGCDGIQAFL
jgi:hypothetical protein